MGSFLSCCESGEDRCQYCNRTSLVLIHNECESCLSRRQSIFLQRYQLQHRSNSREATLPKPADAASIQLRRLFGEYKCTCGRWWSSRGSWQGRYQICRKCKKHVYAHTQRELRSNDMSHDRKNVEDHQQELCQMCMELGYYCGKFRN